MNNLYNDEDKRFIAGIGNRSLIWTNRREQAREFKYLEIIWYIVYLRLKFGVKVRRSSVIIIK
jgi:hypothetical protein